MAVAGLLSYPVRGAFDSYLPSTPFDHTSRYFHRRTTSTMSQAPTSNSSTVGSQSSEDGARMSLPSISNLLGIADGSRPDSNHDQRALQHNEGMSKRPRFEHGYSQRGSAMDTSSNTSYTAQESNNTSSSYTRYSPLIDRPQSVMSSADSAIGSYQRPPGTSQLPGPSYETSPYSSKPYAPSPSATSDGSVYSPTSTMYRHVGSYSGAAPYPGYPPPGMPGASHSNPNIQAGNQWEHHHYISSSAQQGIYPPLPDRYICQKCSKAFSRPSSLKIHSHSHTGEKPFKCPHAGCGKAFSVKSNMKRHEKGCHTSGGQAIPDAYMAEEE